MLNTAVLIFGVDVKVGVRRCEDDDRCAIGEEFYLLQHGNLITQPEGNSGNFVNLQSLLFLAVFMAH